MVGNKNEVSYIENNEAVGGIGVLVVIYDIDEHSRYRQLQPIAPFLKMHFIHCLVTPFW